eukprot:953618-Rhodomonas_salina.1
MNPGVDVAASLAVDRVSDIMMHAALSSQMRVGPALRGRHELRLTGAKRDTPLTLGSPRQRGSIQTHDVPRHRLASVGVGGEVAIHPTLQAIAPSFV